MKNMTLMPVGAGIVLFASVWLGACATPGRVDTETAPAADFSARHTFAWQESQASYDPKPKAQDVERVKRTIHDAVVQQLGRKGFSESQGSAPDFLVSFHLVVTESKAPDLCIQRYEIFDWPGAVPLAQRVEVCRRDTVMSGRTVRQGTLVVFVVDAASRNLLWQGVAEGAAVSRRESLEKLRAAVEQMFVSFPPGRA